MKEQTHREISVLIAAPEIAPYAKTGGLADVMCSLPRALLELGVRVSLVMPAYRSVLRGDYNLRDTGVNFTVPVSSRREVGTIVDTSTEDEVPVHLVRADRYFDRSYPYGTRDGDYPDNAERFAFFCRAILEIMRRDPPQILHANDWQTALAITFLKSQPYLYPELSSVKTVMTVHNVGYQGVFWHLDWHLLNLDWSFFNSRNLEFYGMINFLKGGIVHADAITTVSPTYAEEIQTPEQGFRLEGVFRERRARLTGILNGVDYRTWNPEIDPFIAGNYRKTDLTGKRACKADIQRYFGLNQDGSIPVIGMVTRLSAQKGLDLVQLALDAILARNCQLVVLGSGDSSIETAFRSLPAQFPGQVGVEIGFGEPLAHRITAGSDFLLMPSRYEPCGLAQMYGLKYGTIPIVRSTGGLKDTVAEFHAEDDRGNGFVFDTYEPRPLLSAVARALTLYSRGGSHWNALIRNAMSADFSWSRSAQGYLDTYRRLGHEAPPLR